MKLADLIAKLKATKQSHRKVMKHLERIHREREAKIDKAQAELLAVRELVNAPGRGDTLVTDSATSNTNAPTLR